MFVTRLSANSDYFRATKDFASVRFDGHNITYVFELYGAFLQALIDGNNKLKVSLIKNFQPKSEYFVGTSKKDIEVSNLGFVQKTQQELKESIREATIAETEIELTSILSDDLVSGVGNKTINSDNYVDFLTEVEQITMTKARSRQKVVSPSEAKVSSTLATELFRNTGIYPGKVADISFPSEKLSADSDGLPFAKRTVSDTKLLEIVSFLDYYDIFFSNTNTRVRRKYTKGKAEFERFVAKIDLPLDSYSLSRLSSYKNLAIRLAISNSSDIETSSKVYRFNNARLYEEATAGARNVEAGIRIPDPVQVLPDLVEVFNRETYPVQVTVTEFCMVKNQIQKNILGTAVLNKDERFEIEGTKIYFDNYESRCYAVSANKHIPGISGIANVLHFLNPPGCNIRPKQLPDFDLNIKLESMITAQLTVLGLQSEDESALIYRNLVGSGEKELIGRVKYGSAGITDSDITPGDVYLYTAELQQNAAGKTGFATTGFVSMSPGAVSRINFSLTNKTTKGTSTSPVHSFKIAETISSTPASDFLSSVGASGEAGIFGDEIEDQKQNTTVLTTYVVGRTNKETGDMEYLGTHSAGKVLNFPVNHAQGGYANSADFEYIVMPKSTSAAALSYLTVSEETDVSTGRSFKYKVKKWRDPNFDRAVVLPSTSEVIGNDIMLAFDTLPPGAAEKMTFTKGITSGEVKQLRASSKSNSNCAFISWKYTGDIADVLHFVVVADYNGYRAPIGAAIPDQTTGRNHSISYCDDKLGDVAGQVSYNILPVLRSGSTGKESNTVRVNSTKNYPNSALRGKS